MPNVSAFWGMRLKPRVPPNEGYPRTYRILT